MPELQRCIICGQGSHRVSWKNKSTGKSGTVYVACDGHSAAEFTAAIAVAEKALLDKNAPRPTA